MHLTDIGLLVFMAALIPVTIYYGLTKLEEPESPLDYLAALWWALVAVLWAAATVGIYIESTGHRVSFLAPSSVLWGLGASAAVALFVMTRRRQARRDELQGDQALLVRLDDSLPDSVYEEHDVAMLEDLLAEALTESSTGVYDGDELTATGWVLFMYGPNVEDMFLAVEPVLRESPLARNAQVEIRAGGPEAPSRVVRLSNG